MSVSKINSFCIWFAFKSHQKSLSFQGKKLTLPPQKKNLPWYKIIRVANISVLFDDSMGILIDFSMINGFILKTNVWGGGCNHYFIYKEFKSKELSNIANTIEQLCRRNRSQMLAGLFQFMLLYLYTASLPFTFLLSLSLCLCSLSLSLCLCVLGNLGTSACWACTPSLNYILSSWFLKTGSVAQAGLECTM